MEKKKLTHSNIKTVKYLQIFILIFLMSCSNDDDSNLNDYYFEVSYLGENYSENVSGYVSGGGAINCNSNTELFGAFLVDIETSKLSLRSSFTHYENLFDFENSLNDNSTYRANAWFGTDCFANMELVINFSLKNEIIELDTSLTSSSTINNIVKVSESNTEVTYSIEGVFTGNYINTNNNAKTTLEGRFRCPIVLLK